jgi:hypothetical protein
MGGGKPRVLLSRGIWSQLVELRRGTQPIDPVFPSKTGKVLDRSRVLRIVKEAAARRVVKLFMQLGCNS